MNKPQINQRWKNNRGEQVMVIDIAFNRVRFVRDGYTFPCTYAEEHFVKEFTYSGEGKSDAE